MKDVKVAVVCMQSHFGCIDKNIARMESFAQEAASEGARMVCFPELSVTGYTVRENPHVYAEPIPGPTSSRIGEIAHRNGLVIMAGMLERGRGDKPLISHVVAGPDGIMGVYRKTHLSPKERKIYQPARTIRTFTYEHVCFGIQLCYEAHFPELSTAMSLQGVEIIFFPHASPSGRPEEKRKSWLRHLPARAFDNGVFVVASNQVGENGAGLIFPGVIMVLDPAGRSLCRYTGRDEKMIIAELKKKDLEKVRGHDMRYFLQYRRPELYGALCQSRSPKDLGPG
jgi:predicted amidohydrolase